MAGSCGRLRERARVADGSRLAVEAVDCDSTRRLRTIARGGHLLPRGSRPDGPVAAVRIVSIPRRDLPGSAQVPRSLARAETPAVRVQSAVQRFTIPSCQSRRKCRRNSAPQGGP